MQIFASALSPRGRAGFVMANSAGDAGNAEKEIRKKMVDAGFVDVVVSVGTNMFLNATLSCTLWFFDKRKAATDRKNEVLFMNAQDIYTEIDRADYSYNPALGIYGRQLLPERNEAGVIYDVGAYGRCGDYQHQYDAYIL